MNPGELKDAFQSRLPKYLPETFLLEKNSVLDILNKVRTGEKKEKKPEEEITGQKDIIKRQKEVLYRAFLGGKEPRFTRKETKKRLVNIIKEWHTLYHPTDSDYKNLAEQILTELEKKNLILFFK